MANKTNAPKLKELDESIYDMLNVIRKRPLFYLSKQSIVELRTFIGAYNAGLGRVHFMLKDTTEFHGLHNWVAKRLGFSESTSGWGNMILDKSENDQEAFEKFFTLLDEFRKNQ
jgi:hypothetical protein